MSEASRLRALGALGITMVMLVAACEAAIVSRSPSAAGTPGASVTAPTASASAPSAAPSFGPTPTAVVSPTASAQPTHTATPAPSASAGGRSPAPGGPWVAAGTLASDFYSDVAIPLGDGGALALDGNGTAALRWDPATASWRPAAALSTSRSGFASVPLRKGGILVTGGLDTHDSNHWQSYSSTYVYDASTPEGTWVKVGLLGTARTAPAAAVLPGGRVLVAGGAYMDGAPFGGVGSPDITLASATSIVPGPGAGRGGGLNDIAPPNIGVALATAELFDPSTGRWSPTSSMRFARAGAIAATLSDGRILVVGPSTADSGRYVARMDPRVLGTAEVYDPATGRFSMVGSLPPIDRAAIAADGVDVPATEPYYSRVGTLIALRDGGAFLVGHTDEWKHEGSVTRSFRFDARSGRWRQVGRATAGVNDWKAATWRQTPGVDLAGAFAAALPDGRVLVAGGSTYDATNQWGVSSGARLYDPVTNTWASVPSMPEARQGGVTVSLADGSILLISGNDSETGTASAVRFVPSP
jgi:hypothetical protein